MDQSSVALGAGAWFISRSKCFCSQSQLLMQWTGVLNLLHILFSSP